MSRPTDVSIDLETTSNLFNAGILSIGAVAFNRQTGKTGPEFYAEIILADTLRYGKVSASTLQWWMKQSASAAKVFNPVKGIPLLSALRGLNDFLRAQPANVCVWGNGSSFDITILEHAFQAIGIEEFEPEWAKKFWSVRDLRTLVDVADLDKGAVVFEGTPHNAVDDARHQAKIACAAFAKIKVGNSQPAATEEEW